MSIPNIKKFMVAQRVSHRYSVSVATTGLRGVANLLAAALLARWLGPESYGVMAYLVAILIALRNLIDFSVTSAFFTFISKQEFSLRFFVRYWTWILTQFAVCFVALSVVIPDKLLHILMPEIDRTLLLIAMTAVFFHSQVWQNISNMAEARRLTILSQTINTMVVILHLLVLYVLWLTDALILHWIFLAMCFEWAIASVLLTFVLKHKRKQDSHLIYQDYDNFRDQVSKFWTYCAPYIPYTIIGPICVFLDRWFLQTWSGPEQQANFAVAQQLSLISLLLTTSLLKIFWKEVAELHHNQDYSKLKSFYDATIRRLYFVGCCFFCLVIPWSTEILLLFFGEKYLSGVLVFAVMLFYPVHQSLGQIMITVLHATEKSKLQVSLGIFIMVSGLFFAYFVIAPKSNSVPGLNLGALGLALKLVIIQLLQINIMGWFLCRSLNWKFDWFYQIAYLPILVLLAFFTKYVFFQLIGFSLIISMILSGLVFSILVLLIAFSFPNIIASTRKDLKRFVNLA